VGAYGYALSCQAINIALLEDLTLVALSGTGKIHEVLSWGT
jgi:hypothetical protein